MGFLFYLCKVILKQKLMKTVTVNVTIQLDINGKTGNDLTEVQNAIEIINDTLSQSGLICEPQIFIEGICIADVHDLDEFDLGDEVDVPDPIEGDVHKFAFTGTIKDIRGEYAEVEDMEGDVFTIELYRLTKC